MYGEKALNGLWSRNDKVRVCVCVCVCMCACVCVYLLRFVVQSVPTTTITITVTIAIPITITRCAKNSVEPSSSLSVCYEHHSRCSLAQ
jgi:hypothetical protein